MRSILRQTSFVTLCAALAVAFTGCRDLESGQVASLEDPQSLAAISGCFDLSNRDRFFSDDDENCESRGRAYAAVIADPTQRWLQVAALDTRSYRLIAANQRAGNCLDRELVQQECIDRALVGARFVDFDPRLPGNSGVEVPTSPVHVVSSGTEGVVWVVGQEPRVLLAVDVIHDRIATFGDGSTTLPLDFPVSDIRYQAEQQRLIFADPEGRMLRTATAEVTCASDGANDSTCELTADVAFSDTIALEQAPRFIEVDDAGDVYISADELRWVTRISLDDGSCPPEAPCRIPITWECNDGIDNDGDGAIDTDDEHCYERTDRESPPSDDIENPAECADGIDNDGDGVIDSQDDGCGSPSDRDEGDPNTYNPDTCGDGVDNDQDSLVDELDPQCAAGANNEFGFGDVVLDAPGPATLPRYARTPVFAGPLELTPTGDILIVGERGGNRSETDGANEVILVCVNPPETDIEVGQEHLCTEANTLITRALENDRTREDYLGASTNGTVTSVIAFDRVEEFSVTKDDGTGALPLVQITRFAWAATSAGSLFSILIDETFYWVDDEGDEDVTIGYVGLGRLEDGDRNNSIISGLQADLPDRFPFFEPADEDLEVADPTSDTFFPSLIAIAPYELNSADQSDNPRLNQVEIAEPSAFIQIEPEERFCFIGDGIEELGCLPRPPRDTGFQPFDFRRELSALPNGESIPFTEEQRIVPNGYKIPDEDWTLEWEGSLLIGFNGNRRDTDRRDAVVLDDDGWVRFLGEEPCEKTDGQALCEMEFGWNVCDELEDLCLDGVDVCGNDVDICDVCPAACAGEVDLCNAGAQPGDILVIPPLRESAYCREQDGDCSGESIPEACLASETDVSFYGLPTNERVTFGNQFRIVEVTEDGVRIEPLEFEDDPRWPSPDRLPSPQCFRQAFSAEIIAADSWLLGGTRIYGHDSPYREYEGQCQLRNDGRTHTSRPRADQVWQDPSGLIFEIDSGDFLAFCDETEAPLACRHAMRGYRFRFTSEDRFRTNSVSGIGTLGIASAYSPNLNLVDPLLLFLDMGSGALFLIENEPTPSSDTLR